MMKTKSLFAALSTASLAFFASCNPDSEYVSPAYTVPTTYGFENVDYSDGTKAINMWNGFQSYLGKGSTRQLTKQLWIENP